MAEKNITDASNIKIEKVNFTEMDFSSLSISQHSAADSIFSQDNYGGNQSNVNELLYDYYINSISMNKNDLTKAKLLFNIVKGYFNDATDVQVVNLSAAYAESGCEYMAIANAFCTYIESLENGLEIFKEKFGFDLYMLENGTKHYNLEAIALDMFCSIYKEETIETIINSDDLGINSYMFENVVPDYFASKGIDVVANVNWINNENVKNLLLEEILNISEQKFMILGAKNFSLELLGKDNSNVYYSQDGALAHSDFDGKIHTGIGSHAMIITEIDKNGDVIVSSWSNKYKLVSESITENMNNGLETNVKLETISFSIKEG